MAEKLQEKLEWELLKRGLSHAVDTAASRLSEAADEAMSSLEKSLLREGPAPTDALDNVRGHYGVPPEAAPKAEDPLEKVKAQLEAMKKERAERGTVPETPAAAVVSAAPVPRPDDPVARAKAQLEELKKARNAPVSETPPVKRTL